MKDLRALYATTVPTVPAPAPAPPAPAPASPNFLPDKASIRNFPPSRGPIARFSAFATTTGDSRPSLETVARLRQREAWNDRRRTH
jgi:hypothetical protein